MPYFSLNTNTLQTLYYKDRLSYKVSKILTLYLCFELLLEVSFLLVGQGLGFHGWLRELLVKIIKSLNDKEIRRRCSILIN